MTIFLACFLLLADLSDDAWNRVRKEATALSGKIGEPDRKFALVDELAGEDSERAARLLMDIAAATWQRSEKAAKSVAKAERDYEKISRALRKKRGARRDDPKWQAKRDALKAAELDAETEQSLLRVLRETIGELRSPAAVAVLVDSKSARARRSVEVRRGVLAALWHQPGMERHVLAFARDPDLPAERARVLDWIGTRKVTAGYELAVEGLRARHSSVVRSAVAALQALDDPRCVAALVESRRKAKGQLAEDLEYALHHFTGKKFFGPGAEDAWWGWWRAEGEVWLAKKTGQRFATKERKGSAHFYGVPTRSNRIVFVLDRSASMKEPVPQRPTTTGKPPPDWVPGKNKMEVAKNQLARSIRGLQPDVEFAVVFYSHEVHRWRKELMKATPENKKEAIEWFERLQPVGSTMIFDALSQALRYAPKGADTIFLLSDGAPSTPGGHELLVGEPLEKAVTEFLDANKAHRCIVHTIGVGAQQDRTLMERLARATGGTYRAVGVQYAGRAESVPAGGPGASSPKDTLAPKAKPVRTAPRTLLAAPTGAPIHHEEAGSGYRRRRDRVAHRAGFPRSSGRRRQKPRARHFR
ncbi:MAG: VWA domain-containing protein [Planctomycetota bacterium]